MKKKKKNPKKRSGNPLPNDPEKHIPMKPDKNPDPTRPIPGVNEPEKTDPTRIDEPSTNESNSKTQSLYL